MEEKLQETVETVETERSPLELNEQEFDLVQTVAAKINLSGPQQVAAYGASAQNAMAEFAASAVGASRGRELGETAEAISLLRTELKNFRAEEKGKGFLFALLSKPAARQEMLRSRFRELNGAVEGTAEKLEAFQLLLVKDMDVFDSLKQRSISFYKMLTVYIAAGKQRVRRERETTLANMREIARRTGIARDAQTVRDYEESCRLFDARIYDLEQTRESCLAMMPQIQLLQETAKELWENLNFCILSSVPAWKERIVHDLRLGNAADQQEGDEPVERGRPDGEAAKRTCAGLVKALDDVLQCHAVSLQSFASAEVELRRLESQLQQKVLELI